jgi:polyisoprenoid-binding protein YceI
MRIHPAPIKCLLFATAMFCAGVAAAQTVLYDKSRISCVSRQMNVPVEAVFRKFSAQVVFDPAHAETAKAQIDIDVGSFDIDNAEANDDARGKPWFDARNFPKATFVSSAIRALGGGRYEARGALTIKGKTLEVVTPFTWRAEAGGGVIDGTFNVKRLQYNIGDGVWKDTETVADDVQIRYRLVLASVTNPVKGQTKTPAKQ